jgi:GntR family transcriptional regulator
VDADLEHGSLYKVLTEEYGLFPHTAEETYEAVILRKEDARLLECTLQKPQAAFAIERIAFLENGKPLELTRSVGRGDRLTLAINMLADKADFQRLVGV